MRIGLIVGGFPTLSQTFILDHVIGLLQRGHDVQIVANRPDGVGPVHGDVERFDLLSHTSYRLSRSYSDPAQLRAGVYSGVAMLRRYPGAFVRLIRMPNDVGKGRRRTTLRDMLAIARIGDVDLYHCHFGPHGANLIDVLDVLGDTTPVVSTFHGFDVTQFVATHGENCYDRLFERGDLFLPVSSFFRRRLIELGAPPERTVVHHMGIDVSRFDGGPRHVDREGPIRVITIGRMVEKKGVEYALRAVASALHKGISLTYTIIGDGQGRTELEDLASELGIGDNVCFAGRTSREETIRYLKENDVFLAPSVTARDGDMEGIPVAIMEAMASGLTIVSSRHSGIPEIVIDGETGLLADERDFEALADHIVDLARKPSERNRLAGNGRRMVETEFEIERLNDRIVGLYEDVLAR